MTRAILEKKKLISLTGQIVQDIILFYHSPIFANINHNIATINSFLFEKGGEAYLQWKILTFIF